MTDSGSACDRAESHYRNGGLLLHVEIAEVGVAEECIRNASCTASYYTRFACRHSSIPAVCGDTLIMYMISSTLPVSQLLAWPNVIIGVAFDMLLVSRHSSVSQSVKRLIFH
jgi:hypothetical protein